MAAILNSIASGFTRRAWLVVAALVLALIAGLGVALAIKTAEHEAALAARDSAELDSAVLRQELDATTLTLTAAIEAQKAEAARARNDAKTLAQLLSQRETARLALARDFAALKAATHTHISGADDAETQSWGAAAVPLVAIRLLQCAAKTATAAAEGGNADQDGVCAAATGAD